jgi:ketosteroid isomerase-like protein
VFGKDRAAFEAFYSADAVMYPPGDATITGLDGIGKLAAAFWADPAFAGTFTPVNVEVSVDGSMGFTLNTAALTSTGPNKKPVTERIRDFHVWRRAPDGAWKLVVDIWNAEPAAPAPANK